MIAVCKKITAVIIFLGSGTCLTNVDDFYAEVKALNSSFILHKVTEISLKSYEFRFDNVMGRRLMGFLGLEVMGSFPESVEIAPKYILPNRDKTKPPTILIDYPLVDKSVIFMNAIVAIQVLQKRYSALSVAVNASLLHESTCLLAIGRLSATAGSSKSWLPAGSQHLKIEISRQRSNLTAIYIERSMRQNALRMYHSQYRRQLREKLISQHDHQSGNSSSDALRCLEGISISKVEGSDDLKVLSIRLKQQRDLSEVAKHFDESIGIYRTGIDKVSSTARLKQMAIESLRDDDHDVSILRARDVIMRRELNHLLDIFFAESIQFFIEMSLSPIQILIRGTIALFLGIMVLIIYEVSAYARVLLLRKYYAEDTAFRLTPERTRTTSTSSSAIFGDCRNLSGYGLVYTPQVMDTLCSFATVLRGSSQNNLQLPNLLLIGDTGTGRTLSAHAIAAASGISPVVINGVELASKGNQAGYLLHSILEKARNQESKVVVIIDNADSMISSRSRRNDKCNATSNMGQGLCEYSSGNCCLYLLLEYMREARLGLSLIVTTSLDKVSSVDIAFLDRMDTIIQLPLPNAEERLAFSIKSCAESLAEFMDSDGKASLQAMLSMPVPDMMPSLLCGQEPPTPCLDAHHLDLESCMSELIVRSDTRSLRDIARIFTSLRYEVQCTESGRLTNRMWMQELQRSSHTPPGSAIWN